MMFGGVQAARLTPEGRGAISTVAVEGPAALQLVESLFFSHSRGLASLPRGRIVLGRWGSERGEEVVACRHSTEQIELHCHGGHAASLAILDSLRAAGCRVVDWQTWIEGTEADPIAAAARIALAGASTERTARILLDQYRGALRREISSIEEALQSGMVERARVIVDRLKERWRFGKHVVTPWRVVIAGRPNVGKSSLANALIGFKRAIVLDTPGTTRDVVISPTAIDGWPVEIADTAGIRITDDHLETAGIRLASEEVKKADVVILVLDVTRPHMPHELALLESQPGAIVVHNKADLPHAPCEHPPGLPVSALIGTGIPRLLDQLAAALVGSAPSRGDAMPFTALQAAGLETLGELLAGGRVEAAIELLVGDRPWRRRTAK